MSKIYALCDKYLLDFYRFEIDDFVKMAKFYNAVFIQYRDKKSSFEEKKENIKRLKRLSDIPIIVNDYLDLVQFADGLHIGQEDILNIIESFGFNSKYEAVNGLRKIIGKKILGLSTHNEEEIKEANILDLTYIGLGAFRNTSTKDIKNIVGEKIVKLSKLSKHPVAAIGGVRVYDNLDTDFKVIGSDLFRKWLTFS